MTWTRVDLTRPGGVHARLVFTDRVGAGTGGSSRSPYDRANLASHVGDQPSAVVANRTELARVLDVPTSRMAFMHPDHGRGVALIGPTDLTPTGVQPGAEVAGVDALVTAEPGIGLVALGADCVPALLVDPVASVVAAVHSGWRGLVADVMGAALGHMAALGADPNRVVAHLGPAICGACYPVPVQRAAEVAEVCSGAVVRCPDGQPGVDVRVGLSAGLAARGVRVELIGGCTAQDETLFSHRRDGLTGRQAGAIALIGGRAA